MTAALTFTLAPVWLLLTTGWATLVAAHWITGGFA